MIHRVIGTFITDTEERVILKPEKTSHSTKSESKLISIHLFR